jgi:hypothetical protein
MYESNSYPVTCDETVQVYDTKIGDMFVGGSVPLSNCTHLLLRLPNFTNVITTVVSILNEAGIEMYASSSLARNDDHLVKPDVPIQSSYVLRLSLSGAAGGTGGVAIAKLWSMY